jgi:hypothetical protein
LAPLTIHPAAGVTDPTLDGNHGNASGCTTAPCDLAVLTVGATVHLDLLGLTIQNADDKPTNFALGGAINNDQGGTLIASVIEAG